MSFLARLWTAVRNPVRYVGRDLEGNKFFECPSPNDPSYTKRTVKYFDSEEVWRYIGGGKRLPIQWSAWLTHTRKDPPTIDELQADVQRQQRVLVNVARIEARDRAEAEEMLRIRQNDAQLALADASAQARGEFSAIKVTQEISTSAEPASGITNDASASQAPKELLDKMKVLPPRFLTPSSPRKSISSVPFSLPDLDVVEAAPQKDAPASPWVTKPQETESWTPKAVKRG